VVVVGELVGPGRRELLLGNEARVDGQRFQGAGSNQIVWAGPGTRPASPSPAIASDSARPGARRATKVAPPSSTAAPTSSARLIPWAKAALAWVTRSEVPSL